MKKEYIRPFSVGRCVGADCAAHRHFPRRMGRDQRLCGDESENKMVTSAVMNRLDPLASRSLCRIQTRKNGLLI